MSRPQGTHDAERELTQQFVQARRDPDLTVLEGFHALKHAVRFGAEVLSVATTDPDEVRALTADLAPDLVEVIPRMSTVVSPDVLAALAPQAPRTGVMATARRRHFDVTEVMGRPGPAPIVFLEDPRNMGNLGACIRVAAAAEAAGVLTTGRNDPWHPDAVRGAAGLQYALPVLRVKEVVSGDRPLVAIDPEGEAFTPRRLPARAVLAFGGERHGLSAPVLAAASARLRIPMRPGVSSLNLATSVAAVLYARRLSSD